MIADDGVIASHGPIAGLNCPRSGKASFGVWQPER